MKKHSTIYTVQYQFEGEETIYQTKATSGGLASLEADPYVVILSVKVA